MNRIFTLLLIIALCGSCKMTSVSTTFTNPVINADVPDMDVIRVGDNYYMMSTTMHLMPGGPSHEVERPRELGNHQLCV